MKTKKRMSTKLIVSFALFVIIALAAVAGVITVLALSSRAIDSSISIRFTAVDIEGEVEATYKIGDNGAITSISGNTPYEFKASDGTKNGTFSNVDLSLTSADSYVEFCYTFRNFGHVDYTGILTLDEVDQSNNMTITYKYNDKEYSSASYGLVVEGIDSADASKIKTRNGKQYTEMTYYIKVAVTDLGKSAEYTSDFFWLLEKYEAVPGEEVIPLATSTFTANGDGTYSAAYNGSDISNASTSSVGAKSAVDNVWIVPNNLGSAAVTKVIKGKDFPANTKVVLGDNVTTIESGTFNYWDDESCYYYGSEGLVEIVFGKGITSISDEMFAGCNNLRSVTIGPNVTSIGGGAFQSCTSLTSITIPDSVTSIGSSAFSYCSGLTSVTIPDSVTSIGNYAFRDCDGLTSITMGSGVTSIGSSAFSDCTGLTSITIPDSVTSIASWAFFNCTGLTSVTIGSGVTSIGDYAFSTCYKLVEIYDLRTTQMTAGNYGINSDARILSAGDSPVVHTDNAGWQYYEYETGKYKVLGYVGTSSEITIPSTYNGVAVTEIRQYAFAYNKTIKKVTISEGITSIGNLAFNGCLGLTSVEFKNTTGWWYTTSSTATSGTALTISATDFAANAKLLKTTYNSYYWKRG